MKNENELPAEPPTPDVNAGEPAGEPPAPEKEIDLNVLFPDSGTDLNDLFPDGEMKLLLKSVSKNKKDLHTLKDRFLQENPVSEDDPPKAG